MNDDFDFGQFHRGSMPLPPMDLMSVLFEDMRSHEEGDVAAMPAPGYEDNWEQVSVVYDSGCTFQYAYSNPQTGEIRYETATADDVKKQTTVIICGEYDSDNVLHADRIFLYRLMG